MWYVLPWLRFQVRLHHMKPQRERYSTRIMIPNIALETFAIPPVANAQNTTPAIVAIQIPRRSGRQSGHDSSTRRLLLRMPQLKQQQQQQQQQQQVGDNTEEASASAANDAENWSS